jgi:protein phosphatase
MTIPAMRLAEPLVLPEPCLVVLIGAAGSGKSTFAADRFGAGEILSSDRFRGMVSGDEGNQAATRTAFAVLHRQLGRALADGRTVVVDATNVTSFARRSLLRRAAPLGVPAVAIVLDLDPLLVLSRNATRPGRIVPEDAVRSQLRELARSIRRGAFATDGFAAVRILRSPAEVAGLVIERRQVARAAV